MGSYVFYFGLNRPGQGVFGLNVCKTGCCWAEASDIHFHQYNGSKTNNQKQQVTRDVVLILKYDMYIY